jgi:hypothetical protein
MVYDSTICEYASTITFEASSWNILPLLEGVGGIGSAVLSSQNISPGARGNST